MPNEQDRVGESGVALTERQAQVADGLARHLTYKEIARELGISISAVSKHIAALKQAYDASTQAEIVARHRPFVAPPPPGVEKDAWHDFHLPAGAIGSPKTAADDPGLLRFADGADYPLEQRKLTLDWPGLKEPQVVPRWLDGRNATTARLAMVFGGILALVAALVLAISATQTLSELVEGSEPDLALQNESAR